MKQTILVLVVSCIFQISLDAQLLSRFMVVSDTHHYSPSLDFTQNLLYEITIAAIHEQVDFIFFTGDIGLRGFDTPAEEDSVLKDWRFVLDTLKDNNIKVYACRGNTDITGGAAWDSLFSGKFALPQNGPESEKGITYTFEFDNLLFIALDEFTENYKINQAWLDARLSENNREFVFVAGHTAAFKLFNPNCLGAYPADRNMFWESLTKAGAKAYFCGHDHFYDHSIIDDGDRNPDNDIHQFIVATGGSSFFADSKYNGDNGRWTPERIFHEAATGYVLAEVSTSEVRLSWKHRIERNVFEPGGDSVSFSSATRVPEREVSHSFFLELLPVPFGSNILIRYNIPELDVTELNVYDLSGKKVSTLVNGRQSTGRYEIEWNTGDIRPGMYFCELKTGRYREVRKMILVR